MIDALTGNSPTTRGGGLARLQIPAADTRDASRIKAVNEPAESGWCSMLYFGAMYARKLLAEIVIGGERRAAPLEWLDSFCMRNFTGSAEFDDTLPTGEGKLEAGLSVEPARLAAAMSDWFTKRGKGNGRNVTVEIREAS